jgi:hypothetical protein
MVTNADRIATAMPISPMILSMLTTTSRLTLVLRSQALPAPRPSEFPKAELKDTPAGAGP